uniref:Sigma 54 modulation/S30EA ribosomal protein C-terminal domain-containing protein n=2 Tax=Pseudo-nitzschia australis TaxID=44445 RepID=A0A7S4EF26_9STRA|mmetsp:Transcript_1474/g.3262  ORF Transcript_1474/g.3262 Transcript_1474/m.3262 type:complete len:251 (-) Transcript_1474:324-1076(-)
MTRSSTLLLLLLAPLSASAFTVLPSQSSTSTTAIFMSDSVDTSRLVLTGNNIDLTDSLKEHADKRIGGLLDKLGSGGLVKECEIHLSVSKNPSVKNGHRVDCTTALKGLTIHCKEESPDMHESIDAVAKALQSKLQKYRSRRNQGYHSGNSMGKDLMDVLDKMELDETAEEDDDVAADIMYSEADFIDVNKPNIMGVNSFDLENAIPINEAVFALDYVDHDFFVFKNEETGKASIVYKRNAGGVGLIEIP